MENSERASAKADLPEFIAVTRFFCKTSMSYLQKIARMLSQQRNSSRIDKDVKTLQEIFGGDRRIYEIAYYEEAIRRSVIFYPPDESREELREDEAEVFEKISRLSREKTIDASGEVVRSLTKTISEGIVKRIDEEMTRSYSAFEGSKTESEVNEIFLAKLVDTARKNKDELFDEMDEHIDSWEIRRQAIASSVERMEEREKECKRLYDVMESLSLALEKLAKDLGIEEKKDIDLQKKFIVRCYEVFDFWLNCMARYWFMERRLRKSVSMLLNYDYGEEFRRSEEKDGDRLFGSETDSYEDEKEIEKAKIAARARRNRLETALSGNEEKMKTEMAILDEFEEILSSRMARMENDYNRVIGEADRLNKTKFLLSSKEDYEQLKKTVDATTKAVYKVFAYYEPMKRLVDTGELYEAISTARKNSMNS